MDNNTNNKHNNTKNPPPCSLGTSGVSLGHCRFSICNVGLIYINLEYFKGAPGGLSRDLFPFRMTLFCHFFRQLLLQSF